MRAIRSRLFCAFATLWLVGTTIAAPPSLGAFFGDPIFGGARLSPDGRLVAMRIGAAGTHMRLAVLDLATMKPEVIASYAERDIDLIDWVNDHRLVFNLRYELAGLNRTSAGPGLFAVDADGRNYRALMETRRNFIQRPVDGPPQLHWSNHYLRPLDLARSDEILLTMPEERSREKVDYHTLRRANTVSGRATEIDSPLHSVHWVFDARGELQVVLTRQQDHEVLSLRDAKGQWQKVTEFDWFSPDTVVPRYIGPDGTVYVEAGFGDKTAVYTLAADGKRSAEPVLASKDFDLHPQFIANDQKLLGLRFTVDAEVTQWLDADMAALQDQVDRLLPATGNRLQVPKHGDSPWILVEAFADRQPTTTYAYQRVTRRLVQLGVTHPDLSRSQLGTTDFVHIPARDGLDIPTYLTLPPGENKKNLPMVVLVHGGPWLRGTSWHFDPQVQFLASRGYAVLQAEFRGGTGFGRRHFKAGFKQWGRAMQDDLADATRWAIAQGHADAKRICIAGASYGGYATLMGLINDPDLYRCGVEWVGVTDIGLMFSVDWSDITDEWKKYGQLRLIGDPKADAEALAAVSPLQNAARLKQPLLMAYGEFDARVPLIHGEKFRDAVKAHNPQVEWVVYDKEGHGWSKPETRIDFWGRVEKFLARHIGTPP